MESEAEEEYYYRAIATVEEIQKRLHRPPNSQPLSNSVASSHHHQRGTIRQISIHHELQKNGSRKLEDFLDPVLLSAVRAEIGAKRKKNVCGEEKKATKGYSNEFDKFEQWRVRKVGKYERDEAVDLSNN